MSSSRGRVLFLCTGNSFRSHMAEGLLRKLAADRYEALSAGSNPAGYVHPTAMAVMAEIDVDLSAHVSKDIRTFLPPDGTPPDLVISVCSHAERDCPVFPGVVKRLHWPYPDPAGLEDERRRLALAREVRDALESRIKQALQASEFAGD